MQKCIQDRLLDLVESWIGKNERMDHINQLLIFIMASQVPPRGTKMAYGMGVVRLHLVSTCRCVEIYGNYAD